MSLDFETDELQTDDTITLTGDQDNEQQSVSLTSQEISDDFKPLPSDFRFGNEEPFGHEDFNCFGFKYQPKPWFPKALKNKIERLKRSQLRNKELVSLFQEIAETSIEFYSIKPGHCIAVNLDGKIVESAETEFDLLMKIQGIKYAMPIFVWKVGSNSFAGWKAWQR